MTYPPLFRNGFLDGCIQRITVGSCDLLVLNPHCPTFIVDMAMNWKRQVVVIAGAVTPEGLGSAVHFDVEPFHSGFGSVGVFILVTGNFFRSPSKWGSLGCPPDSVNKIKIFVGRIRVLVEVKALQSMVIITSYAD